MKELTCFGIFEHRKKLSYFAHHYKRHCFTDSDQQQFLLSFSVLHNRPTIASFIFMFVFSYTVYLKEQETFRPSTFHGTDIYLKWGEYLLIFWPSAVIRLTGVWGLSAKCQHANNERGKHCWWDSVVISQIISHVCGSSGHRKVAGRSCAGTRWRDQDLPMKTCPLWVMWFPLSNTIFYLFDANFRKECWKKFLISHIFYYIQFNKSRGFLKLCGGQYSAAIYF